MRMRLAQVGVLTLFAAAQVSAMSVSEFLTKADALKARGPLALFSGDYRSLKTEAETAGAELKAERIALLKAHKPTPYCPPAKGTLGSDELLRGLRQLPAGDRDRMSVKDGMRAYLAKK